MCGSVIAGGHLGNWVPYLFRVQYLFCSTTPWLVRIISIMKHFVQCMKQSYSSEFISQIAGFSLLSQMAQPDSEEENKLPQVACKDILAAPRKRLEEAKRIATQEDPKKNDGRQRRRRINYFQSSRVPCWRAEVSEGYLEGRCTNHPLLYQCDRRGHLSYGPKTFSSAIYKCMKKLTSAARCIQPLLL
jgi:hypothetical protein